MPDKRGYITAHERNILLLSAQGKTREEIAIAMNIAVSTVRTHLGNIYRVLGVSNATGASWEAMRRGLIEPPERVDSNR